MKVHYFQRYHGKENVATANTMLLLSRLYSHSPDKFFRFLKSECFSDSFNPEIAFNIQDKGKDSVPDATITQDSFKIIIETKITDWFHDDQLTNHLTSFGDEKYKVLLTLASVPMKSEKQKEFEEKLEKHNKKLIYKIKHINTTFEILANAIADVLDDRDFEMQDILDDYLDYCYTAKLIPNKDSWKFMRMRLAGATFDYCVNENVYFDKAEHNFRAHETLGLYKDKSIRAIGKIIARITAIEKNGVIIYNSEFGELTKEREATIKRAIATNHDLKTIEHRYFFVERFYETDFKKLSKGGAMGAKIFDLTEILNTNELPETEKIAELLQNKSWI